MHAGVGRNVIAHRPVAAVEHAVSTEQFPKQIQARTVIGRVLNQTAVGPPRDFGNFRIDIRQLSDFAERLAHGSGVFIPISERQVVNDHSQAGREFCDAQNIGQHGKSANDVHGELPFRDSLEVFQTPPVPSLAPA